MENAASERPAARFVASIAAVVTIAGTFLPWGTLTIEILGVRSPGLDFKGTQIGSDIGEIPWGWFMIAAGVLGLIGARTGSRLMISAGAAGLIFAIINALTLHNSTPHASVNGQDVSSSFRPKMTLAWGSYVVLIASLGLLLAGLLARRGRGA